MNSIEFTSSPEVTPIAQKESQKEPGALRLFYKEKQDANYTLHQEGSDFQKMMREAVKLQEKGRDILLNEKDNPNIVHAKSNKDKDIEVGRVIEPAKSADGTFKKGVGEVVLASFFEKLPLDTKEFDASQPAPKGQAPAKEATGKTPMTEEHKAEVRMAGAVHGRYEAHSGNPLQPEHVKSWVEKDAKAINDITRPDLRASALAYMGLSLREDPKYKAELERSHPSLIPGVQRELAAYDKDLAKYNAVMDAKFEAQEAAKKAQAATTAKPQIGAGLDEGAKLPDPQAKQSVNLAKESIVQQAVAQNGPIKEPIRDGLPDVPVVDAKGHKIVLNKTGYELPEKMLSSYHVQDGKFKERGSDALRFEDHGKKLSTPVEDRQVIADMIAVAAAKNWGTLELKGTDNFKQIAWLEAQARGMDTKGYKPNERDMEQLEQLKRDRGIAADRPAMAGAGEKVVANTVEVVTVQERQTPEPAPATKQAVPATEQKSSDKAAAAPEPAQDKKEAASAAAAVAVKTEVKSATEQTPPEPAVATRVETGRLVEHGAAKYNFDPKEKDSYYVKLDTDKGEKTVWGKDLERAISDSKTKPGDSVSLTLKGSEGVVVEANKRDQSGQVVGKETIDAQRNKWEVKPAELTITRTLSKDEQLRVDAASKVLGKAIAKFPESQRENILAKLSEKIDKGEIKLPTPKVTVRSVEKPAPAPSRDVAKEQVRSR